MVLHNSILKFNFEYIMIILRQYSKKNYRKIPKSSKIYIKCHILNCLGFNNYWILLHKINFHWRISMSVNIFPLEVFDFGVSRYCIFEAGITQRCSKNSFAKNRRFLSILIKTLTKKFMISLTYYGFCIESGMHVTSIYLFLWDDICVFKV